MAEIIIMPKLGFNMSEGKLVKWYVKERDSILKDEPFFTIETDKTTIDIASTSSGIIRKLLVGEGDTVEVTLPIAIVGTADESIDAVLAEAMAKLGKNVPAASPGLQSEKPQPDLANRRDFDIVVVGGGPGGYVAAIKAAQMGKRTAIIEKEKFGGVCLNRGCIPTKVLLRSAESLREVKESAQFGIVDIEVSKARLDMVKVQLRKEKVITSLVSGVSGLLKGNKVTIFNGIGIIKDKNTIEVGGKTISTDYIIIATGSGVKSLPVPVDPAMNIMTSNEILNLKEAPESIVIIGGGVIGIEFAYFLSSIGTEVTVVEFLDRILPMVDEEITEQVTDQLHSMNVKIYTGAKVMEVTNDAVIFEKSGKVETIPASLVLMAVGRIPELGGIDCEALQIKTDRGAIVTDLTCKTSVDNIYAVGDVNAKAMLAHTASMEGITAVGNICGHRSEMNYDLIPSAIYIQPEIACVGLTEKQAKEKYGSVKIGKFPLLANGKAKVAGEERGMIKVILEPKYNGIVGVHLYCIHATDMISEAVVAMKLEATAEEIAQTVHPHPTVSEVYHEAFHAAVDMAIHYL